MLRDKGYNDHQWLKMETPAPVEPTGPKGRRRKGAGRTDYLLCVQVGDSPKPLPVGVLEAKKEPLLNFEWVLVLDGGSPRPGVKGGRSPAKRTLDAGNRTIRWTVAGCSGVVHPAMETSAAVVVARTRVGCSPL